jgi:predicted transcriptional regulator of viral defense system
MPEPDYRRRSLSPRESQVVAWLELERPKTISNRDLADEFEVSPTLASDILRRMARKHWLQRVAQGHYEPLLADSGGWEATNPWATLSSWDGPYFVSYLSAAYVHGLTPERPYTVQICLPAQGVTPRRFEREQITAVNQRTFSTDFTELREQQGFLVRVAIPEKVVFDGAVTMRRMNGPIGFSRVLFRAAPELDWTLVIEMARSHKRGPATLRRVATLLDELETPVPSDVSGFISDAGWNKYKPLDLDSGSSRRAAELPPIGRWGIRVNVSTDAMREEIHR